MSYKYEYKLIQHTPMLHFQPTQDGAFLRASSIKSRIDELMGNTTDAKQTKKVQYRLVVRIENKLEVVYYDPKIHTSLYFGNTKSKDKKVTSQREKEEKKEKHLVYYKDEITLEVTSFSPQFPELAFKEALTRFLLFNNIGTRGSKGFGCFWFADSENVPFENSLKDHLRSVLKSKGIDKHINLVTLDWGCPSEAGIKEIMKCFEPIEVFYKVMRSGIDLKFGGKDCCVESAIMKRQENNGLQWDKPVILENVVLGLDRKPDNAYYYRGLLGLPKTELYKKHEYVVAGKTIPIDETSIDYCSQLEKEFDRIPSPLIFKPIRTNIGFRVYIFCNPDIYYHEEYEAIYGKGVKIYCDRGEINLPLAARNVLNVNNLLNYTYHYIKNDIKDVQGIDVTYSSHKTYDTISDMRRSIHNERLS